MALITTYATLQSELLAFLNRAGDSDAVTRAPTWIQLAENEMRLSLSRLAVRQGEEVDDDFSIEEEFTDLPLGAYRIRTLKLTSPVAQSLSYVSPRIADDWDSESAPGVPSFYTFQNKQLRVMPPPDTAYTATLCYYALPALSATVTSNWLLASHPKVYLYASLAEAYAYYGSQKALLFAQDRERILDSIYASDGADQQGSGLRMRINTGAP